MPSIAELEAKIRRLEEDNLRLAQKKVRDEKYSTFVWWKYGNGLACGYVERQVGQAAEVKQVYPTPSKNVTLDNRELMAISNVSDWFEAVAQQNRRYFDLVQEIVALSKEPRWSDWNGRKNE